MRKVLVLWIVGWALFGFPWASFTMTPRFHRVNVMPFRWTRPRDNLLNFAYYVPLGFIGIFMGAPPGLVAGAAALLSGVTEFAQVFSTSRFPSATDLAFNTAGAIVGILLATLIRFRKRSAL